MELLQLVDVRVEEVSRPLREEVAALKLLLARVGHSFEPVVVCSSDGLELANAQVLVPLDSSEQKSSVVEEEQLYGSFSPCGQSPLLDVSAASKHKGMDMLVTEALDLEKCAMST
jgi:hypothetical protein